MLLFVFLLFLLFVLFLFLVLLSLPLPIFSVSLHFQEGYEVPRFKRLTVCVSACPRWQQVGQWPASSFSIMEAVTTSLYRHSGPTEHICRGSKAEQVMVVVEIWVTGRLIPLLQVKAGHPSVRHSSQLIQWLGANWNTYLQAHLIVSKIFCRTSLILATFVFKLLA